MIRYLFPLAAVIMLSLAGLAGCTNSPGYRIAQCVKTGGSESACTAQEWDYEKVNPLPQYETDSFNNTAALQAAFSKTKPRAKK